MKLGDDCVEISGWFLVSSDESSLRYHQHFSSKWLIFHHNENHDPLNLLFAFALIPNAAAVAQQCLKIVSMYNWTSFQMITCERKKQCSYPPKNKCRYKNNAATHRVRVAVAAGSPVLKIAVALLRHLARDPDAATPVCREIISWCFVYKFMCQEEEIFSTC